MRCNSRRSTRAAVSPAAARSLLAELITVLAPSGTADTSWETDRVAAGLLSNLLAIHGRHWPALDRPDELAMGATCGDRHVRVQAEPTDGFAPTLEVCFTETGRLVAWRSTSAEPVPVYA